MPGKGRERHKIRGQEKLTVRLSESDMNGLEKIRASCDFEDMSAAVRWCIHFASVILKIIPVAVATSFVETEEPFCEIDSPGESVIDEKEVTKQR